MGMGILCILLLSTTCIILVHTQSPTPSPNPTLFMAWTAYVEPACAGTPTYTFTTPLHSCLNASNVPFNPFNLTSPFLLVDSQDPKALVGYGCEDAGCGKCPSSEMIPMAQCAVGEWVSNTTGYFMYSVLNGLIPQSQDGGIIYQYYASNDTSCAAQLVGANIQENGVCTNGGSYYYKYNCNSTATILSQCSDVQCSQDCFALSLPLANDCENGRSSIGNSITKCYLPSPPKQ